MKTENGVWVSANEATDLLGVSRATLYAYVSRGRIRSEATAGKTRNRRYARDDIERLRARTDERRNPEKAAEHALHWGLPILESAITLIAEGHIYYRGRVAAAVVDVALGDQRDCGLQDRQPPVQCVLGGFLGIAPLVRARAQALDVVARVPAVACLAGRRFGADAAAAHVGVERGAAHSEQLDGFRCTDPGTVLSFHIDC